MSDPSSPIAMTGLDHVVLRVTDLERSLAFYRDALGCTVERARDDLGLYQMRAGRSLIDLVPVDGQLGSKGGPPPRDDGLNMDHFCIALSAFDGQAIAAHLRRHGIEPGEIGMRYGAEGNGPSMYLSDPDGNVVELKGPPNDTAA